MNVSGAAPEPVVVEVRAFNPAASLRAKVRGFVEADGCIAIEAAHYTARRNTAAARWELLPDHGPPGLGDDRVAGDCPRRQSAPGFALPRICPAPVQHRSGRGGIAGLPVAELRPRARRAHRRFLRRGRPQLLTVAPKGYVAGDGNRDWEETVKDSIRTVKSAHALAAPGPHTLKVWMVDPGVVLQRVLVNTGGLRPELPGTARELPGGNSSRQSSARNEDRVLGAGLVGRPVTFDS